MVVGADDAEALEAFVESREAQDENNTPPASDGDEENPKQAAEGQREQRLVSVGLSTAVAIALHNFPEGLVTYVAYLDDPTVGIALAVGIGIHNIPEGLCVAMPFYYGTGCRWKSFLWGTLSGLSEPLGALLGWLVLRNEFSGNTNGILFGLVGGIMTFIVIDDLFPTAYKFDTNGNIVTPCVSLGMFMIAASLMLFSV